MKKRSHFRVKTYKLYLLTALVFTFGVAFMPFMLTGTAEAYGQILHRSLTLSSGVPSANNVTYTFSISIPSTSQVQGLKFIACNSAVSTYPGNSASCTPPPGLTFASAAFDSQSGWQGATNFAVDGTGANDCIPVANPNILCANRTDTTAQTADTPPTSRTIVFNTVTNPSTVNTAFYVGVYTYSDAAYTAANLVDFGATASAVVQTLTTNAAVAEVLNFCVGSTTINNTTSNIANDCTFLAGNSVNLGTLDTSIVNITPWATNGGDNQNGVAMIRSNAGNGTVVAYDAIQQSGSNHQGTLRIDSATCNTVGDPGADANGNTKTDACINAAGTTQTVFTAGQEMFGMTIAGINSGSSTSYSCTYGTPPGNTCNMKPLANYLGEGTSGSTEAFGTANGFAWDETGTAQNIASSANSTVKQVDDEALILKFAATPEITTPFGPYAAQTDFIAVPTY